VTEDYLLTLPKCSMPQVQKILENQGSVVFALDEVSTKMSPVWRLLVADRKKVIWRVTSGSEPVARKLKSIRQVYQIARNLNLPSIQVPVEIYS